ncbi:hypothetical protein [Streptomyces sp. NPDC051173]|uniref:hypothetical protein n=1 Tax=Streptomyces sp. NPDC051173 TaxID=3155164 RepID=UPI00344F8BFF
MATSVSSTGCARYFSCGVEGKRPAGLTRQDMVGSYKADPFGTVTLKADGTFTASDWPAFNHPSNPKHTGAVSGTWRLNPLDKVIGMDDDIQLSLTGGKQVWDSTFRDWRTVFSFSATGSREKPRIYRFTTDPDICELHTLRHT